MSIRLGNNPVVKLSIGAQIISRVYVKSNIVYSGEWAPFELFTNFEPGVWYDPSDLSTLFQDSAGTTPVTAVEQPVGLMLDKSKGLVLGPELVTNGTFDSNINGWTTQNTAIATWTASGIQVNRNGASFVSQPASVLNLVAGKTYKISLSVTSAPTAGAASLGIFAANRTTERTAPGTVSLSTVSNFSFIFTAAVTEAAYVICGIAGSTTGVVTFDNISVREIPGNHATQTTATSRPVLSARYNLLTKTEQFDAAYWVKGAEITVTANSTTAPDGTTTADTITTNNVSHALWSSSAAPYVVVTPNTAYVFSFYVKRGTMTDLKYSVYNISGAANIIAPTSYYTSTSSEWVRIDVPFTTPVGCTSIRCAPIRDNGATGTVFLWGASLVPAKQADLPYQRVNTATDYDSDPAKFPHYLRFDGVDDWLVTNTITPGTDKVQAFAGVRKLSDAAQGVVAELSATIASNNGTFLLAAPNGATQTYGWDSKGTTQVDAVATSIAAPITSVVTGLADISGDSAIVRINGAVADTEAGDQGTGNFLAYPLYIGRRGGTTLPFNGHLYGLLVRFGSNLPTATIEKTEKYINGLTKAY